MGSTLSTAIIYWRTNLPKKFTCDCGISYIPNPKYKDDKVKCDACIKSTKSAEVKKRAVKYLGGICKSCELKSEHIVLYDFDHLDRSTKSFKISGKSIYRWEELQKELDKCQLLCSNCHRVKEYLIDNGKKKDN